MPPEQTSEKNSDGQQQPEVETRPTLKVFEPDNTLDLGVSEQAKVEHDQRRRQQHRARPVDLALLHVLVSHLPCSVVTGQRPPGERKANHGERDVQPELPAPAQEPDEERAVERTPHPTHSFNCTEGSESSGSLLLIEYFADDRQSDRHHRTSTDSGEHSSNEERRHRGRQRNHDRPDKKERPCDGEQPSAPNHVAQPTSEGHDRHEGDQVDVDNPRRVVEAIGKGQAEIVDDRPQHRRNDGQVVGGNEDGEPDGDQNRPW